MLHFCLLSPTDVPVGLPIQLWLRWRIEDAIDVVRVKSVP